MKSRKRNAVRAEIVLLLCLGLLLAATSANAQSSENYSLTTSVLDEAGGTASSSNYQLVAFTLGQPSPVGKSESDTFGLFSGYIYTLEEALEPDIDVSHDSLFEVLCVDESLDTTLTMCNVGDGTLNWSLTEDPPVDWLNANPTSGSIPPGGCIDVDCHFIGDQLPPGTYSLMLVIESNDPDEPTVTVPVTVRVLPVGKALLIANFMTPEGEPCPSDVILSDAEGVQEFDSVTHIEAEVSPEITLTKTRADRMPADAFATMDRFKLNLRPCQVRELDFYAVDLLEIEPRTRPYIACQEVGADAEMPYQWNPETNTLSWAVSGNSGRLVGIELFIDTNYEELPNLAVDEEDVSGENIVLQTSGGDIGAGVCFIHELGEDTTGYVTFDEADQGQGLLGLTNHIKQESVYTESRLSDLEGIECPPSHVHPQYAVPPGTYFLDCVPEVEDYVSLRLPVKLEPDIGTIFHVDPPKRADLAPFTFLVVAENAFAHSSSSNFVHAPGDSMSVDVSTETHYDWWGCFVLPSPTDSVTVLGEDVSGENIVLQAFYDYTVDSVNSYTLVAVRIDPQYVRLTLRYGAPAPEPDIDVSPMSFSIALMCDDNWDGEVNIGNAGNGALDWSLIEDPEVGWLSVAPINDSVEPGGSQDITLHFDATGLSPGEYTTNLVITSNDPDEPVLSVEVTLKVASGVLVAGHDFGTRGSIGNVVPIDLDNTEAGDIGALQFDLRFNTSVLTVTDVTRTERTDPVMDIFEWETIEDGIRVGMTGIGTSVAPGTGPIANISFSVASDAPDGDYLLDLTEVIAGDPQGGMILLCPVDGIFSVGKGDINDDDVINVIDAVFVVNFILGDSCQTTEEPECWAADCNDDGVVNILDVVGIVNKILGGDTSPTAKASVATARIWSSARSIERKATPSRWDRDPFGKSIELPFVVDTEAEISGAQFRLSYDPVALTPDEPQLACHSGQMTLAFSAKDGELTVILYSTGGNAIPAGTGPILMVPFQMADTRCQPCPETGPAPLSVAGRRTGSGMSDCSLEFTEVILAGEGCQAIPVEIRPITLKTDRLLPQTWSLEQNYPNPFNPTTTIRYTLPGTGERGLVSGPVRTTLKIYNILGQEVATLVDEAKDPGYYEVKWDGRDEKGDDVSCGIYFYRLMTGTFEATRRMVLMK